MGKRIRNLSRRESMRNTSADWITAMRRADLMDFCFAIFTTIALVLATIIITSGGPALASTTSTSPTLAPPISSTSAAGSCVDDKANRYIDCGNGTVTDTVTGLIWLKQSDCLSNQDWQAAQKAAADLKHGDCTLTDGSSAGDWRLPTQAEWEATMKNALALRCTGPTLTNDGGTACISEGPSSFTGVESYYYWSSTMVDGNQRAYFGDLDHGHLLQGNLFNSLRVWPVRSGRR